MFETRVDFWEDQKLRHFLNVLLSRWPTSLLLSGCFRSRDDDDDASHVTPQTLKKLQSLTLAFAIPCGAIEVVSVSE